MKKIPTLFERDPVTHLVTDVARVDLPPGVVATGKWDGVAVLHTEDGWYQRRQVRQGKTPPSGFVFADHDDTTGTTYGWEPVGDRPEHKWLNTAIDTTLPYGTYEAVGPHFQGNPHRLHVDRLHPHGGQPLSFPVGTVRHHIEWGLATLPEFEGVVWWHNNQPIAKIKRRDFGLDWPTT